MELGRGEKPARGSAATGRAARLNLGREDPRLGIEMKHTQIDHISVQPRNLDVLQTTLYREEAGL